MYVSRRVQSQRIGCHMEEAESAFARCERCDQITKQCVLVYTETEVEYIDVDGCRSYDFGIYRFVRCQRCKDIALFLWSTANEPDSEFGEVVYPQKKEKWVGIPETVRTALIEAEKVKHHSVVAYVIMACRVLESIAVERGLTNRSLARALMRLSENGTIPPLLAEAAEIIRELGNAGAHSSGEQFDGFHIYMIDTFLPLLIDYIYITPVSLSSYKEYFNSSITD